MNINNTMANKFQRFLGDMARGFLAPKGNMADYQHAARLFTDDTFRLAPKNKFLFYVVFNVNPNALDDVSFEDRHLLELNYLVKAADLPKYTLKSETLNQYNRKTTIYTGVQYEPVTLTLHDDNNGITNMLWALYYGYYIADRLNSSDPYSDVSPIAYDRNTYESKSMMPFRYGLDNDSDEPFFNSIQLFTMSRQRFFSYLLCNPKITKWDHDSLDYSEGNGVVENKMTLAYDAVIYNSGVVQTDDPAGFAVLHYDKSPSPIVGPEMLKNGMAGIFGDLFSLNAFGGGLVGGLIGGVLGGLSSYTNTGNRTPFGYGQQNFFNPQTPYTPYSTSGFQQYGFGAGNAQIGLTGALAIAGVGIAANVVGNVISGVGSLFASSDDKSKTVESPNNEKPKADDVFGPPAPTAAQAAQEQKYAALDAADQEEGAAMRANARAAEAERQDQEDGARYREAATSTNDDSAKTGRPAPENDMERDYLKNPDTDGLPPPSTGEEPAPPQQTNDTQEIIDSNPGGTGNAETDVGSPLG